jgi:dipeptidyl aminopeptidase/acylaminoacyl peptidase
MKGASRFIILSIGWTSLFVCAFALSDQRAISPNSGGIEAILRRHNPDHQSITREPKVAESIHRLTISSKNPISDPTLNFSYLPLPQADRAKIAFTSNRDGSAQIYLMNPDGTEQTRLTYSGSNDDYSRWAPNGMKILFQSDRDHPETEFADVYVMNADGSAQTRLTSDVNDDSAAVWSPDGSKIAFQSARNGVTYQVYVMSADGSGQVNISNGVANDTQPSGSPDGTRIAFASDLPCKESCQRPMFLAPAALRSHPIISIVPGCL